MFEALVCHGEEVRQGERSFATVKPKPKQRGPLGFAEAKRFIEAKEGCKKGNSRVCLDEEVFDKMKDVGLE